MLQVVLDVNVLVSAAIGRDGPPRRVIQQWQSGAFEAIVSDQLLAELEHVLGRREIATRADAGAVSVVRRLLDDNAIHHADPGQAERAVPADPKDDYLIALARAAGAHAIVTGDRHLLEIDGLQPPALDPGAFLSLLEQLDLADGR